MSVWVAAFVSRICQPSVVTAGCREDREGTVDGSEIRLTHQLRLVVWPIIYREFYIPGGAGFLNHQQYVSQSFRRAHRKLVDCGLENV